MANPQLGDSPAAIAGRHGAPLSIDVGAPNAARMYDYYLGGNNNFPADREAAEKALRAAQWLRPTARANRAFLGRAVSYLAGAGIRQFVDIGTGLPTQGNVHEVARRTAPDARIAYVDNDPVVLGHSRALLADTPNTATIRADLRDPGAITTHPDLTTLIDWAHPVGVLLVAVLHFITDEENPAGILTRLRAVLAPGSHVVISHLHHPADDESVLEILSIYRTANAPLVARSQEHIKRFFEGFELVQPGLVPLPEWHPAAGANVSGEIWGLGGVGKLPAGR